MMGSLPGVSGRKALVIDDSKLTRVLLEGLLCRLDFCEVLLAATGVEGLSLALEQQPSLIILDHQLPDGYGEEFTKQIRLAGITAPIIAITGTLSTDTAKAFLDAGANQLLVKPIDARLFETAVKACEAQQA